MAIVRVKPHVEVCRWAVDYMLCEESCRENGYRMSHWERCNGFATEAEARAKTRQLRGERWPGKYRFRVRRLKGGK